ncbi:MAG TPA: hypothetical protein VJ694_03630, partial [Patescibacteria group bacterium]|nr:hypothetical protein [Patescibacteria group bacterium]
MKRLMFLIASCLAACGDNLDRIDPVDMTFVADVTELENSCDGRPLGSAEEAFVDAVLRADGTVELREGHPLIPGPGIFPNVRPHGGLVDYDANRYSVYPDKTYPYRSEGALSMDGMDLTLTEHWYRTPDFSDCVRKVRIAGKPRGFRDASSLDGRYEILTSYYGEVCGADPWPASPLGEQVYVLDAHPRPSGVVMVLGGAVWLEPSAPASDGAVDWDGRLWISGIEGIEELDGGLHGRFTSAHLHAELTFHTDDQAPGCRHAYLLHGGKRAAEPVDVGGDYRAVYRLRDECEGTVKAYEGSLTAIRQGPDEVEFYDDWGDWFIDAAGGSFHETDGTEADGQVATFSGTSDPPYLSYSLEFRFYDADGSSCVYAWDVDAVARYAPEFDW